MPSIIRELSSHTSNYVRKLAIAPPTNEMIRSVHVSSLQLKMIKIAEEIAESEMEETTNISRRKRSKLDHLSLSTSAQDGNLQLPEEVMAKA